MGGFNPTPDIKRDIAGRRVFKDVTTACSIPMAGLGHGHLVRVLRLNGAKPIAIRGRSNDVTINHALGHLDAVLRKDPRVVVQPADDYWTERFGRRILAQMRTDRRPGNEDGIPPQNSSADILVSRGLKKGRLAQNAVSYRGDRLNPHRRAVLPHVPWEMKRANERLAKALGDGVDIPNILDALVSRIRDGDKEGHVEVCDFIHKLRERDPKTYERVRTDIDAQLRGSPKRRFQKICDGTTVAEADFN